MIKHTYKGMDHSRGMLQQKKKKEVGEARIKEIPELNNRRVKNDSFD
jgi:hypothetical protein